MTASLEELATVVRGALADRGQTVGCAESLTGGDLASVLSAPAGASAVFTGAVVSYATSVKRAVLGVEAEHVVSGECAEEMAAGARAVLGCHWAVSTTGVAGPDTQEQQPVGTVFVGVAGPDGSLGSVRTTATGDRAAVRLAACAAALDLLLSWLEEERG